MTVGKPEVVINGETRPLDVPPEMYQGHVVVPVRVISEGMGAYVQWVPDRRIVVVRYLPPTPPPPPPPPAASPPAPPTPAPTPVPTPVVTAFIAGDCIISPKVYNEFSPGNTGTNTNGRLLVPHPRRVGVRHRRPAVDDRRRLPSVQLPAQPGVRSTTCRTNAGAHLRRPERRSRIRSGRPGLRNRDRRTVLRRSFRRSRFATTIVDARLGLEGSGSDSIYIGVGYMWRSGNYGYPRLNNVGSALRRLPDLDQNGFTWYGSAYYYPNVKGTCTGCSTLGCTTPYR